MRSEALILGLLFFVHSFAPEHSGTVLAMAGAFWAAPKGVDMDYDPWLVTLLERFDPPRKSTLFLTPQPIKSRLATVYWPKEHEVCPKLGQNTYRLVVVEQLGDELSDEILTYAFDALVYSGTLVIMKDGQVIDKQEKE